MSFLRFSRLTHPPITFAFLVEIMQAVKTAITSIAPSILSSAEAHEL